MYSPPIQRLIELFSRFPGIGPRQAARFVFYILKEEKPLSDEFIAAFSDLKNTVDFCSQCYRSMTRSGKNSLCSICLDPKRNSHTIAITEKESDMHTLEKTGAFGGVYHNLGGVVSPLDPNSTAPLHLKELYTRIKTLLASGERCEVILSTNPTTEGDTTALYIERILEPLKNSYPGLTISKLGRGLSLGSELEHVDEITLKSALNNRK